MSLPETTHFVLSRLHGFIVGPLWSIAIWHGLPHIRHMADSWPFGIFQGISLSETAHFVSK